MDRWHLKRMQFRCRKKGELIMPTCICCGRDFSKGVLLLNHIIRSYYNDDEHHEVFESTINQLKDLFFNIEYDNKSDLRNFGFNFDASYKNVRNFWENEFGPNATKERLKISKRRSVALGTIMFCYKCDRETAKQYLRNDYDLSHIKPDKKDLTRVGSNNKDICPVCGKRVDNMMLYHCNIYASKNIEHKKFVEEQNNLIISLFNKYEEINEKGPFSFGIYFSWDYCTTIWRKEFGIKFIEEKRLILEKRTKSLEKKKNNVNSFFDKGKTQEFKWDEIIDHLIVPQVNFVESLTYNTEPINKDICFICGRPINETTMWNHATKMRDDLQHMQFLIDQANLLLKTFNDLSFDINEQADSIGLCLGNGVLERELYERCFGKDICEERLRRRRALNNAKFEKIIPYAKISSTSMNPFVSIDWNKFNVEKIKNMTLNLHYSDKDFAEARNKICPVCHEHIECSLYEHLKMKRLDPKHLKMFEEQVFLAIQLFFVHDAKIFKELKSNFLVLFSVCTEIVWKGLFPKEAAKRKKWLKSEKII